MSVLTRKISALEKNVLSDEPNPKDTYLGTNNKDENELFRLSIRIKEEQKRQAIELEKKMKTNPTTDYTAEIKAIVNLSEKDQAIVTLSNNIYRQRVMHLFENAIAQYAHFNDPGAKNLFYMRFYWFLLEIQDYLWHYNKERSILDEPGFFDLCPGEREKKLKPVYDTWRGKWFSDKSFNRWRKICTDTSPKPKYSKEKEKELMDMDCKYKEQDAVHLKEKCPTCKNQCEWYIKQLHETLK